MSRHLTAFTTASAADDIGLACVGRHRPGPVTSCPHTGSSPPVLLLDLPPGTGDIAISVTHAKVADARREFHHQLATKLISDNQGIAVEDLSVAGLARTRPAKSVHDAGWAQFVNGRSYSLGFVGSERHTSALGETGQALSRCP